MTESPTEGMSSDYFTKTMEIIERDYMGPSRVKFQTTVGYKALEKDLEEKKSQYPEIVHEMKRKMIRGIYSAIENPMGLCLLYDLMDAGKGFEDMLQKCKDDCYDDIIAR